MEFSYTDPNGNKDIYFYEVPQIDDDTEGAKLPLMQVNKTEEAVHIDKMISLSQARPLYPADGDKPAMAGSTWSHDYDMPYLEKGID